MCHGSKWRDSREASVTPSLFVGCFVLSKEWRLIRWTSGHFCIYKPFMTPCLSNEGKAFFTNFITAWFSVGYVAITLTDNDLQLYFFPVESRGVLVVSLESTTIWLQSDYSGKFKRTLNNYHINLLHETRMVIYVFMQKMWTSI